MIYILEISAAVEQYMESKHVPLYVIHAQLISTQLHNGFTPGDQIIGNVFVFT
jgi:hypothetical protein